MSAQTHMPTEYNRFAWTLVGLNARMQLNIRQVTFLDFKWMAANSKTRFAHYHIEWVRMAMAMLSENYATSLMYSCIVHAFDADWDWASWNWYVCITRYRPMARTNIYPIKKVPFNAVHTAKYVRAHHRRHHHSHQPSKPFCAVWISANECRL